MTRLATVLARCATLCAVAIPGAWADTGPAVADPVTARLYAMYGAVLHTRAEPPPVIRFRDEAEVAAFQAGLSTEEVTVAGRTVRLQAPAARALADARDELAALGLTLRLRGARPAGRSYADTVRNWHSRLDPGLRHWVALGRLDPAEAARIQALPDAAQVAAVLELETRGLWCNTDRDASILTSVAAPGSSQHHSLLAVDVAASRDPRVAEVMARHGWFRTVYRDPPHFTWLGVPEASLPELGLVRQSWAGLDFWIPR